jgi:glycosyltransferase involved in cell wall biosynthesis
MSRVKRYLLASIRNAMECCKFGFRGQNKRHSVTVIVPTINSAGHLDIVLDYYKRMGVSPVIFVDAKSTDDTFRIASNSCEHVHLIANAHGWVEGMVESISRSVATGWALRVDDDELPSRAVLEMCRGDLSGIAEPVVSFPRRNCGLTRGGQFAFDGRSDEDRQFRLYRVNMVSYTSDIHSPAIVVDRNLSMRDPHFLIHFDWAVHDYEQRRSKVERYDRIAASAGDRFRKGILFEEDPGLPGACVALNAPEFVPVAAAIASRFPRSCVL